MDRICIIGQGYIGIPTALILADQGFNVIGVDNEFQKIALLKEKKIPFHETELDEFAKKVFKTDKYIASQNIIEADVFIICVPTPYKPDHTCNFEYVISATESIKDVIKKGNLIILESTVPPNTCENIIIPILEKSGLKAKKDFFVAHAPERLIPGNMIEEIVHNDRIIGGIDKESTERAVKIYKTFCKGEILETDSKTAELCKLMENTYRDVNIALANEFALIGDKLGINVYEAIELANHHPRVNIHTPGPGVGGHCIPKDPWYIYQTAPELAKLIKTSREINNSRPGQIVEDVLQFIKDVNNPVITIFGAAYKANVDDPRDTPTKYMIDILKSKKIDVRVYDPLLKSFPHPLLELESAVTGSDCIIYVVNHDLFKKVDIKDIKKKMRNFFIYFGSDYHLSTEWLKNGFKTRIFGNKIIE